MKCPNCINVDFLMSERKGIEIDYCPNCRGVWLDRGELDKFIQQADQQNQSHALGRVQASPRDLGDAPYRYEVNDDDERSYKERGFEKNDFRGDDRQNHRYGKKKESFWGELFDFD